MLKNKIGTTVISVAVIDDIISLVILAIILQLHATDGSLLNLTEIGFSISQIVLYLACLLYTSPSPRDGLLSRMPSSA